MSRRLMTVFVAAGVLVAVACAPPPSSGGTAVLEPGCYDADATFDFVDVEYFGPVDVKNNVTAHNTFDGTCGGAVFLATVVWATSEAEASTKCQSIAGANNYGGSGAPDLLGFGYQGVPPNYWICGDNTPV